MDITKREIEHQITNHTARRLTKWKDITVYDMLPSILHQGGSFVHYDNKMYPLYRKTTQLQLRKLSYRNKSHLTFDMRPTFTPGRLFDFSIQEEAVYKRAHFVTAGKLTLAYDNFVFEKDRFMIV